MTRHVFTNPGACRAWANASTDHGKGSHGSVYFTGRTIYSYGSHFPMAYRAEIAGQAVVLFNPDSYSISTSRHQSYVRAAARHLPGFMVPDFREAVDMLARAAILDRWESGARWPSAGWASEKESGLAFARRVVRQYLISNAEDLAASGPDGPRVMVDSYPQGAAAGVVRENFPDWESYWAARDAANETARAKIEAGFVESLGAASWPLLLTRTVGLPDSTWPRILADHKRRAAATEAKEARENLAYDKRRAARAARMSQAQFDSTLAANRISANSWPWDKTERLREIRNTLATWRRMHRTAAAHLGEKTKRTLWSRVKALAAFLAAQEARARRMADRPEIARQVATYRDTAGAWAAHLAALAPEARTAAALADSDTRTATRNLFFALRAIASQDCPAGLGLGLAVRKKAAESLAQVRDIVTAIDAAEAEERAARYRAQAEARMIREKAARESWLAGRESWLAGETGARWRGQDADGRAYVRAVGVERDESGAIVRGTLETSQGAKVPLAEAVRVFRFVKLCRDRGQAWHRNGQRIPVGGFQVDEITESGDFRAGCHAFAWAEIARLADSLGLAEIAGDESAVVKV